MIAAASALLTAAGTCKLPAVADSAGALSLAAGAAALAAWLARAELAADADVSAEAEGFGAALLLCVSPRDCSPPAHNQRYVGRR